MSETKDGKDEEVKAALSEEDEPVKEQEKEVKEAKDDKPAAEVKKEEPKVDKKVEKEEPKEVVEEKEASKEEEVVKTVTETKEDVSPDWAEEEEPPKKKAAEKTKNKADKVEDPPKKETVVETAKSTDGDDTESKDAEARWNKAEEEAKQKKKLEEDAKKREEDKKAEEKARRDALLRPQRAPFQSFVNMVSLFAIMASIGMAAGQILGPSLFKVSPIQWILRVYVVCLCFVMIFVEFQWTKYARESSILRTWVPRGVFYIFIGVLGLEENEKSTFRDLDRNGLTAVQAFVTSISWVVVGVGFGYILLGATCMQKSYNELCEDYQERRQKAYDMKHGKIPLPDEESPEPTGGDAV